MTGQRHPDGRGSGVPLPQSPPSTEPLPALDEQSVTQLLGAVESGQAGAWNRIYALLYRDLH